MSIQAARRRICLAAAGFGMVALTAVIGGCAADSWFDPSVLGRYENTPAVAPILDRLDIIESELDETLETTPPTASDLIPEVQPYVVGVSDVLTVDIFELFAPNTPYQVQRVVDQTGRMTVPLVGDVECAGYTEEQIRDYIKDILDPDVLIDPQVSVIAETKRENTFTIIGPGIQNATMILPEPRFLLLDALAQAGGIPATAENIYIIRQIPLSDKVVEGWRKVGGDQPRPTAEAGRDSEGTEAELDAAELEDLIDELTDPALLDKAPAGDDELMQEPAASDAGALDLGAGDEEEFLARALEGGEASDAAAVIHRADLGAGSDASNGTQPVDMARDSMVSTAAGQDQIEPAIEVPDPSGLGSGGGPAGKWLYLNGKWVRVVTSEDRREAAEAATRGGTLAVDTDADQLVTQRIIRIPVRPLLEGNARYNIVVRPDDVVRLPDVPQGFIYIGGEVARPGPYTVSPYGDLTLTRAIEAAGGLGPLGIPEKVDVTRLIAGDRQITVKLNLRAIYAMTEPDVYLKPGDRINVGTTWYAAPLAVIRNGFRMTYGFGFLLDRNWGNDVFGPPPTRVVGN
ncbi:MAG: hypothetical protein D8M59_11990 [Planctomycetes bacterium]|nr:hypothetical protein [Planctomycetota bacterium]NOG53525.1 hypothetical protein [Planctomycetota bacterium]